MGTTAIHEKTTIAQEYRMGQHAGVIVFIALHLPGNVRHHHTETRAHLVKTGGGQEVRRTPVGEEVGTEEDQDPRLLEAIHQEETHVQGLHRGVHEDIRDHQ